MKRTALLSAMRHVLAATLLLHAATASAGAQDPTSLPCDRIGQILGGKGSVSGTVCRVNLPRGDLNVMLLGAKLPVGMGLTSWAGFLPTGTGAMAMGDLALTAEELPRVMSGLKENGLDVTAVHNHMLGERPGVMFMHFMGMGDATDVARKLHAALERAPSALGKAPAAAPRGQAGVVAGVPCSRIEEILGTKPGSADTGPGFCKVTIPRPEGEVAIHGVRLPSGPMGVSSWFAFQETEDGRAAVIAGDMSLLEAQVNPAVAALKRNGIDVVALHNHMIEEQPRIMFFHFQARGEPTALARGLRAGIDAAEAAGK